MQTKGITSLIAGTGLILSAAPAFATTIDGINFPTTTGPHTFIGSVHENITTTVGNELTGGGTINALADGDSDETTDFCATPGCSLTYKFGGFTLENITEPTAGNNTGSADFSGGFVNFYANGDMDNPWLTTVADTEAGSTYTLQGTLINDADTDQVQNLAGGLLSVNGGSAASIFDNNSYQNGNGDGSMSDLLFNTSLSPQGEGVFSGSADGHYTSNSSAVPEPGVLGMLALGLTLIGLGAAFRQRRDA